MMIGDGQATFWVLHHLFHTAAWSCSKCLLS